MTGKRDKGSGAGNPWVNKPGPDEDDGATPEPERPIIAVGPGSATAAVAMGRPEHPRTGAWPWSGDGDELGLG